jgi:hypothetical protein
LRYRVFSFVESLCAAGRIRIAPFFLQQSSRRAFRSASASRMAAKAREHCLHPLPQLASLIALIGKFRCSIPAILPEWRSMIDWQVMQSKAAKRASLFEGQPTKANKARFIEVVAVNSCVYDSATFAQENGAIV